ncbi:hypothetical protein CCACVL1_03423 [Corchorus capsularis]|uniref:Uncharacterized protein n=1 Tax=Corchorus capsularis TaxID=210143 RepID=A0A1R3JZI8_COCAP|nr:hypothetical protein CCACVL1_03423 [Corchorus capsularis]
MAPCPYETSVIAVNCFDPSARQEVSTTMEDAITTVSKAQQEKREL